MAVDTSEGRVRELENKLAAVVEAYTAEVDAWASAVLERDEEIARLSVPRSGWVARIVRRVR